jgi:hypothetical protein
VKEIFLGWRETASNEFNLATKLRKIFAIRDESEIKYGF